MSELEQITAALQRTARRRRLARALHGLWNGLFIGGLVWLLILAFYKFLPLPVWSIFTGGIIVAVSALIGFLIGYSKPSPVEETARWVDGQQHFQERLSTALEVAKNESSGDWRDLIVSDAANRARELDPRNLVRFRLPKIIRWTLLVLAMAAGLGFIPEYRSAKLLQKQAERESIREAGEQLAELTRRSLETRKPALEPTEKSVEAVGELGAQLAQKVETRSEALRDITSVSEKLKEQLRELGKDPGLRKLEQAARNQGGGDSQTAAGTQKQIEAMQKSLGDEKATPEAIQKLKQQMDALKQQAEKAFADKSSSGSEADRQNLSAAMSALSRQAEEMGLSTPNLDEAMEALAANQTDLFLKDLQAATTDMEKLNEQSKQLSQLKAQAEKIGKDLAEQLKNGQAEAAQSTLEKMVQQLRSNLTPEQLKQLLDDVSKAVDPASPYGEVAQDLKNAANQMQQGNKSVASQSLADAAKKLEELMKQMADAQQLADSLAALEKASQCVGTGQRWGQCKKPGGGKGDKPGSGVGTWGDDNLWLDEIPQQAGWDNSGVNRPDTDPVGMTDRGESDTNPNFTPSKVKGQFSQGGPMPSITLKGVSIKGQSRIDYEEAATAAQSDAQSALSQEKVPRAYQNSVRDYFDDLKK